MDGWEVLADAGENLYPARMQMALSLGWHIIFSCFGIAFPLLTVFTEWRGHRRGDAALTELAHTWAKAMGVLFAAGAVSGTLLSFEMGILWPGLMDRFGEIYGFPFVLEGFAFFIEAIFVGIYLFGWNRLSPRAHMLSALPMIVSGMAGAFFVVAANAWMNNPTGFRLDGDGRVVDAQPWAAMFGPSTWPQVVHMLLGAYMVTGFTIASVYAVGMLRGRRDRRSLPGLLIPLTLAALVTPVQIGVGDWIAKTVAENQPAKLAAMEGVYETSAGVPLSVGGLYYDEKMHYALEIPRGLSLLIHHDPDGVVQGLEEFPADERPPVNVVHLAFDTMVGLGFALLLLSLVFGGTWWRRRRIPGTPWFLRAVAVSGVGAVVALEAGWVTTEVGRQPWIVYGIMRTSDAVSPAPGLFVGFYAVVVIYLLLTALTAFVLRRLASHGDAAAPQEVDAEPPGRGSGEVAVR
ncbi:MAG: cytochrome ubiquinol oxidase subunit [Blastococcus sp.]|nr:cytochrome ubiquinol oxidase subunit [Blastococcus sp.]